MEKSLYKLDLRSIDLDAEMLNFRLSEALLPIPAEAALYKRKID